MTHTPGPRRPPASAGRRFVFRVVVASGAALALALTLLPGGCAAEKKAPPVTPPPTFTGPRFLHGTVGSLTTVHGYEPLVVSGWGIVVNLQGTGSGDVPAYLKDWLTNEMVKRGLGSPRLGTTDMSPGRVLADPNKSVVRVEGIIPPGAKKGTRFDVRASALPGTQTTSLEGGQLWTTDLAINGANPQMRFSRPLAAAGGPVYLNPFDEGTPVAEKRELSRSAAVLSGGIVRDDRELFLTLNQPSWQRSRSISDRINERFPRHPSRQVDTDDTAVAKSDSVIQLHIPSRFMPQPGEFLALISHLYLQRAEGFETGQAKELGNLIAAEPRYAVDVAWTWEALGKTVLPVLREHYAHPNLTVRFAALQAGVRLADEGACDYLATVTQDPNPANRKHAAELLAYLPRSIRGAKVLHSMLDDDDRAVRLAAYQSLSEINDPGIQSLALGTEDSFKFILDLVPARKPLIYINQTELPRIVIFNPDTTFKAGLLARLWDNHLMLRTVTGADQPVEVFYQVPGQPTSQTHKIAPTLANLIFLLAHKPNVTNPTAGLDLPYSKVTSAIYTLCKNGWVEADLELQTNPLADALAKLNASGPQIRPDTLGPVTTAPAPTNASPGTAAAPPTTRPDAAAPDTAAVPIPITLP